MKNIKSVFEDHEFKLLQQRKKDSGVGSWHDYILLPLDKRVEPGKVK